MFDWNVNVIWFFFRLKIEYFLRKNLSVLVVIKEKYICCDNRYGRLMIIEVKRDDKKMFEKF